jgi:hypothetical protein
MQSSWFVNTLALWQWGLLAAIPPAIVLLYFLKLKRRPLEVPSTYLWSRALEDLHVNSIWQRLRQNLLLFLQLLFIALLALALIRPGWQGAGLEDERLIFLIDTSASMQATDGELTRLELAKQECLHAIDAMDGGSLFRRDQEAAVAMVISFSDVAQVEQTFTNNKNLLRARVRAIQPTNRRSNLEEALRAAAGLANPGRSSADATDVQVANPLPATLYVFSDGGFRTGPEFALGNLKPMYVKIGEPTASNVAITSFSASRNPDRPGKLQTFARVENFGPASVSCQAALYLNGNLLDAQQLDVPARAGLTSGGTGVQFDLDDLDEGILRLELDFADHLALDNTAHAVLNLERPARVLVVSPGPSKAMRLALTTDEAQRVASVQWEKPSFLETKPYADAAATGQFDLILYDRCVPPSPPQANTLFIGRAPTFDGWTLRENLGSPAIFNVDTVHPLTQLVDMPNVIITNAFDATPPRGGLSLIDANLGSLLSIHARQSFEDAVLGFEIITTADDGSERPVTDWSRRRSFPVFFMNALKYLGGAGRTQRLTGVRPGDAVPIRTLVPVDRAVVTTPEKAELEVLRENRNDITFTQTESLGVYEVREGSGQALSQQFAVNLFDDRESDLLPADNLRIGYAEVESSAGPGRTAVRQEWWKAIALLGLGIVLLEWYVYHRRVYI